MLDARTNGVLTAVLFVDLNGIKQINDTCGHETGDGLLVGVSRALEAIVSGPDVVARLGGDEFGIVWPRSRTRAAAESVAERISNALRQPLEICGRQFQAATSIGIAVSDRNCADSDELLRRADQAMYHAKRMKDGVRTIYHVDVRVPA